MDVCFSPGIHMTPQNNFKPNLLRLQVCFFYWFVQLGKEGWKGWAHEWWRCSWWWAWSGEETRRRTVMNFFPCDESPWVWKRTIFLLSNVSQSVREQLQEAKLRARVMRIQLPTLRLMQSCGTSDTGFSVPSWSQAVTWRPGGGCSALCWDTAWYCYVSLFILGFWFHENLMTLLEASSIPGSPAVHLLWTFNGLWHSRRIPLGPHDHFAGPSQPLFEEPSLQVRCCSQCEHAAKVSHLNLEIILICFQTCFDSSWGVCFVWCMVNIKFQGNISSISGKKCWKPRRAIPSLQRTHDWQGCRSWSRQVWQNKFGQAPSVENSFIVLIILNYRWFKPLSFGFASDTLVCLPSAPWWTELGR